MNVISGWFPARSQFSSNRHFFPFHTYSRVAYGYRLIIMGAKKKRMKEKNEHNKMRGKTERKGEES